MKIDVDPDQRNTNQKKSPKKGKGRDTIEDIGIIYIGAFVMTKAALVKAIVMTTTLQKKGDVMGEGNQRDTERNTADEIPTKAMIQAMAMNLQTPPLLKAVVAVNGDAEDGDHLEMQLIEAIAKKDGKIRRAAGHHREYSDGKSITSLPEVAVSY